MSRLGFNLLGIRRRTVAQNLQIALPTTSARERQRIGTLAFRSFVTTVLETMAAGGRDLASTVELHGGERLQAALAGGQGCLLLCIHIGNWEALAACVARQIAPTHVVVKKVGKGPLDTYARWLRQKMGYDAIQNDGNAYRQIARALKRNEVVGFVMDQYQPGAPLLLAFGVPTKTNTGLATIWRRSGVPVFPVLIRRIGVHKHSGEVWPELTLTKTDDPAQDVKAATQVFNETMEQMILTNPEQYFWLHDRWKWGRLNQIS